MSIQVDPNLRNLVSSGALGSSRVTRELWILSGASTRGVRFLSSIFPFPLRPQRTRP
jgi:hypothetical protein